MTTRKAGMGRIKTKRKRKVWTIPMAEDLVEGEEKRMMMMIMKNTLFSGQLLYLLLMNVAIREDSAISKTLN